MNSKKLPIFEHERFLSKIKVNQGNDCWEWTASKTKTGNGIFSIGKKTVSARTVSLYIFKGEYHHKSISNCDNKNCINPDHCIKMPDDYFTNIGKKSVKHINANMYKESCKRGHPYDYINTYSTKSGGRQCRACQAINDRSPERKLAIKRNYLKKRMYKDFLSLVEND